MNQTDTTDQPRVSECVEQAAQDLASCHPACVLLFGSAVAFLEPEEDSVPVPGDIDLLVVGGMPGLGDGQREYDPPVELHRLTPQRVVEVARWLRYDPRPLALARLYGSNLLRQNAIEVIAAAILLGPAYNAFGIEQIQLGSRIDDRDYSRHRILLGRSWWQDLTRYARERRGTLGRYSDKVVGNYRFRGI